MPVLAICRGSQLLNIARGGDLVQHLPEIVGHERHKEQPGTFSDHDVSIAPESRLGELLGEHAPVKSHHHQGMGKIGDGLRPVAWDEDGYVEGLEDPEKRFALGVLWHPEEDEDFALFKGLVDEAIRYREARARDGRPQPGDRGDDRRACRPRDVGRDGRRRRGRARPRSRPGAPSRPADRARLLRRVSALVEEHGEELARLESRNAGKPISDARGEIGMVADVFQFYAGAIDKHHGETIPVAGGVDLTFREPLGVVGLIVPWNFPLNIASWKLGPALACGNTVVLKPAELTPLSALRLAELALEAGIPEGVLNVVPGKGSVVGERLVEHPDVAKIGFTGSTEVGRGVMRGAAGTIKRVTLELGGKSANVVFADADLEAAAAGAPYAVFGNAGQDCCARSRILVERSAYDRFVELLVGATAGVRVGDPEDDATEMGPLSPPRSASRSPRSSTAMSLFRGDAPTAAASGSRRTLVEASNGDRVAREEVFGPVAAVIPFADEEEAVRLPTTRRTGSPARSGRATSGARCGSSARSRPASSRSTRTRRCASRRRSAASSSPASAANWACTRWTATPRSRTCTSPPDGRRLDGKVVVITGAGAGMGREAALVFSAEGASVCVADVDASRPRRRQASRARRSRSRSTSPTPQSVAAMYAATAERYGGIDVLYNNAGISPADDDSILETEEDAWDRVQAVNTKGVYLCCRTASRTCSTAAAAR